MMFLRHYKGGIYRVLGIATHSETGEEHVVYYSVRDGKQWVRPRAMFDDIVEYYGQRVKRFVFLESLECPECNDVINEYNEFWHDHKYSIKQSGMCFHCCRHKLGQAGYGE